MLLYSLYNGLKIDWDQDLDILASITGNRGKWIETLVKRNIERNGQ